MTARRLQIALLLSSLTVTLMAFGPPPAAVSVTSTIDDSDGAGLFYQIQSDGGNYLDSKKLVSQLQSSGANWVLDALNPTGATRTVWLDFGQSVGTPIQGLPPSGNYKFRMVSNCSAAGYGNSLQSMTPGQNKFCPLHIEFPYGGTTYALEMNNQQALNGSFPETTPAVVTCGAALSTCTNWSFTSGTINEFNQVVIQPNQAKLLKYGTSKGKTVAYDQGDFYLSFHFVVAS